MRARVSPRSDRAFDAQDWLQVIQTMDSVIDTDTSGNGERPWLLNASDRGEIERYLVSRHAINNSALPIGVARAGAGNMNLALRVSTADGRTFILKQGRPWVEKYPHIPAPFDRTIVEAAFYAVVQSAPAVASRMPAVLHVDADNHVVLLEDIGSAGDFTSIYATHDVSRSTVADLLEWLEALSHVAVPADQRALIANRAMRALNHEHIFAFPLRDGNGLDLDAITSGLADEARGLIADDVYVTAVSALGRRYLSDGDALVHGDYFPGSWLKSPHGPRIIDPEFCFMGDAEFDCGVFVAHLAMAQCSSGVIHDIETSMARRKLDRSLVAGYAGAEIMRRLIGVAQLPLALDIESKRSLLRLSRRLVVEPEKGLT